MKLVVKPICLGMFVLLCLVSGIANAATCRPTGIFSDLYYNEEAGDLLGMEMEIIPDERTGFKAFIQLAEGGAPFAIIVPLSIRNSHVEFTIPKESSDYGGAHFIGTLSCAGITGNWGDGMQGFAGGKEEILKRGKSYWQ